MKTTTSAADPKAFHKLQEMVRDIDVAMVTTVTPEGALRSRPMATRKFDDDGVIWFFTSDESGMAHDLQEEHAVNVSYADPKKQRFVSVTGAANMVHDREKAKALWHASLKSYFPHGLDEPHLALLTVRIENAEFWESPSSKMVRLFEGNKRDSGSESPDGSEHTKVEVRATPASG